LIPLSAKIAGLATSLSVSAAALGAVIAGAALGGVGLVVLAGQIVTQGVYCHVVSKEIVNILITDASVMHFNDWNLWEEGVKSNKKNKNADASPNISNFTINCNALC